jgi:predicted metal-binding protein
MDNHSSSIKPIRPVNPTRIASECAADLGKYCELASEMGASDCRVVEPSSIVVDERVRFKCAVPKCFGYDTCANCPPHAPSVEEVRGLLARFSKAVVMKLDVRPEAIVRDRETIEERAGAYKNMFNLVSAVESAAFYDGHYLAVGFGAGSCKSTFCHKSDCAVLKHEKCRHNLVARPSMEAVGIDCFALAASLGWEILPIGSSARAESVTSGLLMGMVLVD